MKRLTLFLLLAMPASLCAQLSVVSTTPADNATSVPLVSTLTFTFNDVLDTNAVREQIGDWSATNVDSGSDISFSSDGKSFSATMYLAPNTAYFFGIFTAPAMSGGHLASPFAIHFTTGSSFPSGSVSGNVLSGATGVLPDNAVVILSPFNMMTTENDGPGMGALGKTNPDGSYTVPYVPSGTYWPLAAKDANDDGNINPEAGADVIAFGDSIVVGTSAVTGVNLTFVKLSPLTYADAIPIGDSLARDLPGDRLLKAVSSWDTDTLGRSDGWTFLYVYNSGTQGKEIRVSNFMSKSDEITDMPWLNSLVMCQTLSNPELAANSATVLTNVEAQGGKAFRTQVVPDSMEFRIQMRVGDMSYSEYGNMFPTPGLYYWGVSYSFGVEHPNQWNTYSEQKFLCNYTTGAVEKTTGVTGETPVIPSTCVLYQNYPNPFNPVTTIRFAVPQADNYTLTVYDLLGRAVAVLADARVTPGTHSAMWDASRFPSGVYYYRLDGGGYSIVKKLLLLK